MATPQPGVPTAPTKVCPHCAVQSQTASDKCPACGKKYKVKVKKRGGCLRIVLGIIALVVVIAVIGAAVKGKSKPVTAADVTQRVTGSFVRSGCFGCTNTAQIQTSNVYCGWDGNNVIVHVVFTNTSSRDPESELASVVSDPRTAHRTALG